MIIMLFNVRFISIWCKTDGNALRAAYILVFMTFVYFYNQGSGGSKARTTNIMSSNSAQSKMYSDTTLCDKVCQLFAAGRWFPPGPPVSSANKIDRYDITEILLKVALNTNNSNFQMQVSNFYFNDIHNPRNL